MNFEQFEEFLFSDACYNNHDVSIIDMDGRQHYMIGKEVLEMHNALAMFLAQGEVTIKIEQMEKYWDFKDRTIHLFYNPKNGPSFDTHSDPVDVLIECKDGTKSMEVDGKEIILKPGDKLSIPANTPHRALNYEKALMASHGISDTETLTRIR